jgi:hypothetical protein
VSVGPGDNVSVASTVEVEVGSDVVVASGVDVPVGTAVAVDSGVSVAATVSVVAGVSASPATRPCEPPDAYAPTAASDTTVNAIAPPIIQFFI